MFAVDEVHCQGQVIGGVVACDQDTAQVFISSFHYILPLYAHTKFITLMDPGAVRTSKSQNRFTFHKHNTNNK